MGHSDKHGPMLAAPQQAPDERNVLGLADQPCRERLRDDGSGLPVRGDVQGVPPRSFPPSFNPANILESMLDDIKTRKMLKEGLDPDQVRGALNQMTEQQLQNRGVR
jgi:hypothetical protein